MKVFIAAVAMAVLSVPAFANDDAHDGSYQARRGAPDYGPSANLAQNQRDNAASFGNACLTRGTDDPRFEASADTCPVKTGEQRRDAGSR